MCGLVGMAGDIAFKDEKVMRHLLVLDTLRGVDSTGVAVIGRTKNNVKVAKKLGHAFELLDSKAYDKAMLGANRAIIGHNRYATQGAVNAANAHPFEFDSLVGAHNGTLTNKYRLADAKDFEVDSENLYHHIDKHGLRDAINIIEGAWALTWWDKDISTINFLRNDQRPLFITRSKNGRVVYWASEAWMLTVALARENVDHLEITPVPVDTHYSIHIDNNGNMEKAVATPCPGKPAVKGYTGAAAWSPTPTPPAPAPVASSPVSSPPSPIPAPAPARPTLSLVKGEEKNERVAPSSANQPTNGHRIGYENSKNASLEVLGYGSDRYGACYYNCFDLENPGLSVRLYFNPSKTKTRNEVGTRFTADIGPVVVCPTEGTYYKVVASSVRLVKEVERTYTNCYGKEVSFNDWMSQHGTCDNCGGNVFPTEKYQFTRNKDVICEFCTHDPTVKMIHGFK